MLLYTALVVGSTVSEKFRFDNYSLYKVLPKNAAQIKLLQDLHEDNKFDFWSDPVPRAEKVSILTSPKYKAYLESYLNINDIKFEVSLPNIQEIIDKEAIGTYTRSNVNSMGWESYYTLESIYTWIDDLAKAHPSVVSVISGGTSLEGRDIQGLKISHGSGKRIIFIECGIHSREWISPAVCNYMTNELLTSNNEETRAAARDFDWYIFPVTNPDGYVWTHTEFRMWHLNRNWNNNWLVIGASTNPSSQTYAGTGPFSEPETRTLSEYIQSMADKIDLYLSFHSSGQLLLLPFGNTTEPLANYDDAINIGRRAMGALSVRYGTPYTTGNIAEAIYHASGSSVDWVKEHLKVPLVYCYELRDRGTYGHLLPADQILPTGQETMDSVLDLIHQAKRFGYMNSGNSMKILYKILPKLENHISVLKEIQNAELHLDFWNDPIPDAEYVMVLAGPSEKRILEDYLNLHGIDHEITITNVQEHIDKEIVEKNVRSDQRSMVWNVYYTLDGIYAWLDNLIAFYPNIVSPIVGGVSYEGRPIRGIKISHGPGKRAVFIEAGIHAREWISPATVNFITNELLSSDDEETKSAARDYDWYIFPVTNPDGYVWSHEQFRMWRKNRRPIGSSFGVDLNRNWNNNWLVHGSSINPAADNYAGPGPFSEPESRSLSTYIENIGDQIDLYLSFHSFGQLLLIPFGNTTDPVSNYHDAMNIGRRAMGALSVRYGTPYVTGNIAEAIYLATGGSVDWVKEAINVPLVYCYELRDRGQFGFLLPQDQILATSEETMDSLLELIHQAKRFGYMNKADVLKGSALLVAAFVLKFMI
ncbi:hypothetical protein evm_001549 [Chilo suppressalis]|nr:hypothetical protein evm_001549 [Chilo suppressalis]